LLATDALLFLERAKVADAGAVSLYVGELLQGFEAPTIAFDQWLRSQRQQLDDVATMLVVEFSTRHSRESAASAIKLARQLLERDRLNEPLHRALMQLLVRAGDRTGALVEAAGVILGHVTHAITSVFRPAQFRGHLRAMTAVLRPPAAWRDAS
jgi:DNA-binding SARP family transcriptional activator